MRSKLTILVAALLIACAPADEAPEAVEAPPAPAGPTLADFAGSWENSTTLEGQADPVMVTVRTAAVLQNGAMVGNLVATYRTDGGEEVVRGTFTGTRMQ